MPIEGRSLEDAAKRFQATLNRVLNKTLTRQRLVMLEWDAPHEHADGSFFRLSYRSQGLPSGLRLQTVHGPMALTIAQVCGAERLGRRRFRLYTFEYRYTLTADGADEPWIRWEYLRVRPPGDVLWSRHHVQGRQTIDFGNGVGTDLNRLHLPSGWVPIEDVIRFCLVDLGVRPLTDDWDAVLDGSYQAFKNDYVPAPGER